MLRSMPLTVGLILRLVDLSLDDGLMFLSPFVTLAPADIFMDFFIVVPPHKVH